MLHKLLACSNVCVCMFNGSTEPRGSVEDAMLCYDMLCYAIDKLCYDMLCSKYGCVLVFLVCVILVN